MKVNIIVYFSILLRIIINKKIKNPTVKKMEKTIGFNFFYNLFSHIFVI
jgi:hypothetical protein